MPFPIPDLPSFAEQSKTMKEFLVSLLVEVGAKAVVSRSATLLKNGTMTIDTHGQMQTLARDAFKRIAEKARNEKRSQWKPPQNGSCL